MSNDFKKISRLLQEPFHPEDIEWRVQSAGVKQSNYPWAMVFAYVTNRAIQQRLDDVVGFGQWRNEYRETEGGWLCGLSLKVGGEWITKWDGSERSAVEALKGGLSGAMKRAAVQWGVGRYLYNLETYFAKCSLVDSRKDVKHNHSSVKVDGTYFNIDWETPPLPEWALPSFEAEQFCEKIKASPDLVKLKAIFAEAYLHAKSFGRTDLKDMFQTAYDVRKDELDKQAQLNVEIALDGMNAWVNRQLKTLELIPEASSVERICQTMRGYVAKQSDGQYYDTSELYEKINQAELDRVAAIQNQLGDNNE